MSVPAPIPSLPRGSRCEVTFHALAAGGDAIARVDGCVVFVPGGVPGDSALVEVVETRKNHVRARLVAVTSPSPSRRAPSCALFGRCGGCTWQHVDIAAQRAAKGEIVRSALERIAAIHTGKGVEVIGAEEYGWRTRAVLHVTRTDGRRRLGFQHAGSHEIEAVDDCPVLVDSLRSWLGTVAANPEAIPRGAVRVHVAAGDEGVQAVFVGADGEPVGSGPEARRIERTILGRRLEFDARGFFQAHRSLAERLVETALSGASGIAAVDLYCGVGLFTLALATKFEKVLGVDGDPRAVESARGNARGLDVSNVRFERADLERPLTLEWPAALDLVLVDPPRAGLSRAVLEAILEREPPRISYVSCDPATLARDLRELCSQGYELEAIVALDLFPQTPHVEAVAQLCRVGAADPLSRPTRSTARS